MNYANVDGEISQNVRDVMLDDEEMDVIDDVEMSDEEVETMVEVLRQRYGDDHDEVDLEVYYRGFVSE